MNSYIPREEVIQQTILRFFDKITQQGIQVTGITGGTIDGSELAKELTLQNVSAYLGMLANTVNAQSVQSLAQFILNGVTTTVVEDTVTPANNAPLPVKLTSATGDINITAGDLNVHLSHAGANYDSTRVGDGTNLMAVNADGSINVNTTIAATGIATELTLTAVLSELQTKSNIHLSAVTNVAQSVKNTAGRLKGWNIINPNTYPVYAKFYNTLFSGVTVGVTAIVLTLMVPAQGSIYHDVASQTFSTAISVAVTKNLSDADSTALDSSAVIDVYYI